MNADDVITALMCCAPNDQNTRDCGSCPFRWNKSCHSRMCEAAVQALMDEHANVEHYSNVLKQLSTTLHNAIGCK